MPDCLPTLPLFVWLGGACSASLRCVGRWSFWSWRLASPSPTARPWLKLSRRSPTSYRSLSHGVGRSLLFRQRGRAHAEHRYDGRRGPDIRAILAEFAGRPFYVNVWPDDVRSPFFPSVNKWRETKRGLYLAVLEEMDRQLGRLFDYVRHNEKLRNNTLILICSDNGHEPGAGEGGPLKGCKTNLYEGGIRSPLVVWGPGLVAKKAVGTRNDSSVFAAIDLVPSLLELAGAKNPSGVVYDGEPLLDTVLGQSRESRQAPIFFSRPPDRKSFYGYKNLPDLAMRQGRWKLLCDYDGSRAELYDLEKDVSEDHNVADANPQVTARLSAAVVSWWHSMSNVETNKAPSR